MQMKKENNLVRRLEASETMGGANEICTDKTGTLTKNQMTVEEFYTGQKVYKAGKDCYKPNNITHGDLINEAVLYNCSARLEAGIPMGNCTEKGLLHFLLDQNVDVDKMLKDKESAIMDFIPFSSRRKRATTAIRLPHDKNTVRVFSKGAPEIVLEYVDNFTDKAGTSTEMDEKMKKQIKEEVIANFAKKAYRTMLLAYCDYPISEYEQLKKSNGNFEVEKDREVLESGMTMIAIFAIRDPLRDEIKDSVILCHNAGINIRMVTGDNIDTAKAISLDAGIIKADEVNKEYVCMTGAEFRELVGGLKKIEDPSGNGRLKEEIGNKQMFKQIAKNLKVLARSTPEDKYTLVIGLKEIGSVVAVTGDGTNDAPALKVADVGFSMGITGTEVAKEASDIVLLDDNFSSIVTAVKWGRNIYTNVRKFLQFQLTVNCAAMFIVFLGGMVLGEAPLTSVQMLWVNLIMDTFAALALATEPPSLELLN